MLSVHHNESQHGSRVGRRRVTYSGLSAGRWQQTNTVTVLLRNKPVTHRTHTLTQRGGGRAAPSSCETSVCSCAGLYSWNKLKVRR